MIYFTNEQLTHGNIWMDGCLVYKVLMLISVSQSLLKCLVWSTTFSRFKPVNHWLISCSQMIRQVGTKLPGSFIRMRMKVNGEINTETVSAKHPSQPSDPLHLWPPALQLRDYQHHSSSSTTSRGLNHLCKTWAQTSTWWTQYWK